MAEEEAHHDARHQAGAGPNQRRPTQPEYGMMPISTAVAYRDDHPERRQLVLAGVGHLVERLP